MSGNSATVFFSTLSTAPAWRINEGLHLCVGDIDKERMTIVVGKTKGGKRERIVPMPQSLYLALRKFWVTHRNPVLLFPFTGSLPQRSGALFDDHPTDVRRQYPDCHEKSRSGGRHYPQSDPRMSSVTATRRIFWSAASTCDLFNSTSGTALPIPRPAITHLTQAALNCSHEVLQRLGEIRTDDITD